jgi:DNA polymerase-1
MLEYDIETTGLQNYHHEMFMAQFLGSSGEPEHFGVAEWTEKAIQTRLDSAESEGGLQAWNSKFDFGFTEAHGFKLPPEHTWHDGMLKAHVVDERFSAALKARGDRLFPEQGERDLEKAVKEWLAVERRARRKASKETGEEYTPPTYKDVPDEIMVPYGRQDVILQRKVTEVYDRTLSTDAELHDVYELERGVMAALFRMERRGVPVDRAAAAKYEVALLSGMDEQEARLKKLAGIDTFNPNAPAQVAEALTRRGVDLSNVPTTKTGAKQMNADTLGAINDELAQEVLKWKANAKVAGTYLAPMLHGKEDKVWGRQAPFIAGDERIHPNFRQLGAVTGRMSCSDPNLQNWPRDDLSLRYLVRAEPGHKLVCCDLDAIEMRLFAAFCGKGVLLDQVSRPDGDPHAFTAQMVGLTDRKRPDGSVTSARQLAKVFNFQMIYGGGVNTVSTFFGVSRSRAKEMINRYHQAYPEIGVFQNRIRARLEDQGYIKTPWKRRHRADQRRPIYQQAYKFPNKLVQGTAADLLKDAILQIHKAGVPMILPVHDEIIAHVPEEDAQEAARIIERCMIDHPRISKVVPLSAEAVIVDRWSDVKQPGFVPAYIKEA